MLRLCINLVLLAISARTFGALASPFEARDDADYTDACARIEKELSSKSLVYWPGSQEYNTSVHHWAASSAQPSACAVSPATAEEVGLLLNIVAELRIPFAIKSGAHTTNPGFSSTPGVLIVPTQFNETVYNAESGTATIGLGQVWDPVYAELQKYNVTVPGVRSPGVGVGGYITGGGYSWITGEYGLGVDSVVGYELVQPNGTVAHITEESNQELFWALKGTVNNFGIITRVTMKTYPQELVWGGTFYIGPEHADDVARAFANFTANLNDPKAGIIINHLHTIGTPGITTAVIVFYNAPELPSGVFDELLAIPRTGSDVGPRRLTEVLASQAFPEPARISFEHLPNNEFPLELVDYYFAEMENLAVELANTSVTNTVSFVEYFKRDFLKFGRPVANFPTPSAWPPTRDFPTYPNAFGAIYENPADSNVITQAVLAASDRIREKAAALGVANIALNDTTVYKYPNYAHYRTTPQELYGDNLPILVELREKYDPEGVMKLTGGFRLP